MKILLILAITLSLNQFLFANEFEDAKDTIELRQISMQGIWARVKRLAPFIDVDNDLDYSQQFTTMAYKL